MRRAVRDAKGKVRDAARPARKDATGEKTGGVKIPRATSTGHNATASTRWGRLRDRARHTWQQARAWDQRKTEDAIEATDRTRQGAARARAWLSKLADRARTWERPPADSDYTTAELMRGYVGDIVRRWWPKKASSDGTGTGTDANTAAATETAASTAAGSTAAGPAEPVASATSASAEADSEPAASGRGPTSTTTSNSTSYSTGGTSVAPTSRILIIAAEDFPVAAAKWGTDDMMVCDDVIANAHDIAYAWARGFAKMADLLGEDYPVHGDVVGLIQEQYRAISTLGAGWDTISEAFRARHREDIERRLAPRIAERKWNVEVGDDETGDPKSMHIAAEEFAAAAARWETDHMMEATNVLREMHSISAAWARGFSIWSSILHQYYPIDHVVTELIADQYTAINNLGNGFNDIYEAFKARHEYDIKRHLKPRRNEHRWNHR
ncbi:hypothetical protein [Nonomuraea salmonea]